MHTETSVLYLARVRACLRGTRIVGALLFVVASGATQSPAALAETLFQDAKKLMDEQKYAAACPKLAESQRLDPGTGTLILLAACHEREGKLAAAWSEYVEAQAQATQAGRKDRIKAAEDGVKRISPRLSRLSVSVRADAKVPGLVVKVDGATLAEASWGSATPTDPGEHVVEATAPGRVPNTKKVILGATAETKTIEIGPLELAPVPVPAQPSSPASATPAPRSAEPALSVTPPPAAPSPSQGTSRTPAYMVGGLGAASLVVGAYFGLKARSDTKSANSLCPEKTCTNEEGLAKSDSAGSAAKMSNVFVGLGLVGVGVGAYLWVRSGTSGVGLRVGPTVGAGRTGLAAEGAF